MSTSDDHGRVEPAPNSDELTTLTEFLEFHRTTLAWKTSGLGAESLRAAPGPGDMTLGGLLKHLARVEENWFSVVLHGRSPAPPWHDVDWSADADWDWRTAVEDSPEDLRLLWSQSVQRARAALAEAVERGGLDQPAARSLPGTQPPNLRWILVHMIEEYARHNGHADFLREAVDGQTGE